MYGKRLWRVRDKTGNINVWINFEIDDNIYNIIKSLNGGFWPSIGIMTFETEEDIIVFRIRAGI